MNIIQTCPTDYPRIAGWCPNHWDQLLCWKTSKPNQFVYQPCFNELNGVKYDTSRELTIEIVRLKKKKINILFMTHKTKKYRVDFYVDLLDELLFALCYNSVYIIRYYLFCIYKNSLIYNKRLHEFQILKWKFGFRRPSRFRFFSFNKHRNYIINKTAFSHKLIYKLILKSYDFLIVF